MVEITCPSCGKRTELVILEYDVPYFGKIMLTSINCNCGFKHNDCIVLGVKDPVRYSIKVGDDLFAKVIRSTSGTIRIPEIGVTIEPGPASQAFITNVEGILDRVRDIVLMAMRWRREEGDEKAVKKCEEILETIDDAINGKKELTLILEDPLGNSMIASRKAEKTILSNKEAKELKMGMTIMDISGMSEEEFENQ